MLDTVPHMLRIDGPRLRELRLRRLLTIAELAEIANLDESHIASVERGEVETSRTRTIKKLANALEVPPDEILSSANPNHIGNE